MPEARISSVNGEDAILTNVHFQHGKVRAIMDTGAKINLIHPGKVEQLGITYQERKEPITL